MDHVALLLLASGPPSLRYTALLYAAPYRASASRRPPHIWPVPSCREMEFIPSPVQFRWPDNAKTSWPLQTF
jgi:hypothetical protein